MGQTGLILDIYTFNGYEHHKKINTFISLLYIIMDKKKKKFPRLSSSIGSK